MKKSINIGGDSIIVVPIQMPVSLRHFAKALADDHRERKTEFDPCMKKGDGIKMLKSRLLHHGISGIYTENWDGTSDEFIGVYNRAYADALTWIGKHFPYLSTPSKTIVCL